MAFESQGALIWWSNTTAASSASTCLVGEVVSFNGPTGSAAVIDVSALDSTAKRKLMGLPDEGNVSLEVNLSLSTLTNAGQKNMIADRASRSKKKAQIRLNDTLYTNMAFDAYVTGFAITGGVEQALKASITLEIDGPIAWSTVGAM